MQEFKPYSQSADSKKEVSNTSPVFIQPKLTVNEPGDASEQEADRVAEQVVQSGPVNTFHSKSLSINPVQRKETNTGATGDSSSSLDSYVNGLSGKGEMLSPELRSYYEPRFGQDFSNVRVHTDGGAASSAQSINALAYTSGNNIVFNNGQYAPGSTGGKKLLAHELTHVVQQQQTSTQVQRQTCNSPHDKMVAEDARRKLAQLEPELDKMQEKRLDLDRERALVRDNRARLDKDTDDASADYKRKAEERNMDKLNKAPVKVTVTGGTIVFNIKFQAFFHDPAMKKQITALKQTMQQGIDLVWNQTIKKGVFADRKFVVQADVTQIDSLSQRSNDAWLIEIRADNNAKVVHAGCKLDQPEPGVFTSVTDPLCDNGVMNIPPAHITNAGILGHEMLHLFGLIDRYVSFTDIDKKTKKKTVTMQSTRNVSGRKDPLGADDGTILSEDLQYIFDEFGVYGQERDKATPRYSLVEREVWRLRKIVETGCDENSLLPIRKDFNDKIIKSAEDLD